MLLYTKSIVYLFVWFCFCIDAIASADNVRIAPSLKSQKGLYLSNSLYYFIHTIVFS